MLARRPPGRYLGGMRVRCGTSGFSYQEWHGAFYPAELPAADRLAYYAARLPAVEINQTFYRMPTAQVLSAWRSQVPEGFSFALKGSQRITHLKRLRGAGEETARFHEVASTLGPSLGPVLWQLPPNLKLDLPRLREFLASLPPGARPAFEFRHESWRSDEVLETLRARGAALVWAHGGEEEEPPLATTAAFGYLRLRAPDYGPEALRAWAGRILAQPWEEAWVFFKHEDEGKGPAFALAMMEVLGEQAVRAG